MLRVEEHPATLCAEERHRIAHHRDALDEVGAQGLGHVQVPRLAHQAHHLGAGLEEIAKGLRRVSSLSGAPGHAERGELCMLQCLFHRELEELRVARVGARPAPLDEGEADLVELVQDAQPILNRVGQVRLLRAVAKRRVVELDADGGGHAHAVAPSTTRSPT